MALGPLLIFSVFTIAGVLSPDIAWFSVFRFLAGFGLCWPGRSCWSPCCGWAFAAETRQRSLG